ncbi:MAG: hypothetical protein NZL83_02960 [Candidatus Absconditabacterales bacterium]|nr:hypothetical protein [Candidatus Absconditabacterales bacterium]
MPAQFFNFLLNYIKGNNKNLKDIVSHFEDVVNQVKELATVPGCEIKANKILASLVDMKCDLENLALRHKGIVDKIMK